MYRVARSIFVLLLLILVLGGANSATKKSYSELLHDEKIELIFKLLTPRRVLLIYGAREYEAVDELEDSVNYNCTKDLDLYTKAIGRRELWALKLLDASSIAPTGILEGNIIDLGHYDECMKTRWHEIRGHHCMYEINPMIEGNTLPYNPTMSICLPSSCDRKDVIALLNATIVSSNAGVSVASVTCANTEPYNLWRKDFIVWAVLFGAYIAFLGLCTGSHIVMSLKGLENETFRTLTRFSLLNSAMKVLTLEAHKDNLPVVNGLRVLSTAWIVYLHAYFIQFFGVNANLMDITKWYSSWKSVIPLISSFSVDTFFTISGFLMTYTFFKQMQSRKVFDIKSYYFHRFIRLTPPMAIVMYFILILSPFLIDFGPRMGWIYNIFLEGCKTKWWSSILYIQNFIDRSDYRILHYWSLSVDMQLFWISPIILYPLYKKPKHGLLILGSLLVGTLSITAAIVGINGYRATFITSEPNLEFAQEAFQAIYLMPYTRASPWLLGILLGFEITYQNFKLSKNMFRVGWLVIATIFSIYSFGVKCETSSNEYNTVREVIFAAFSRPVWSICICWIIYASYHNAAGPISRVLSWKYFLPLSRICYSVYLVHLIFPVLRVGSSRVSSYFNDISILQIYAVDLVLSFILGFFNTITFEIPIFVLEDILFRRKTRILVNEKEKEKVK